MRRLIRAGFLATKERKEHKDHPSNMFFFVIYAFFRGYTDRLAPFAAAGARVNGGPGAHKARPYDGDGIEL